jgi:monoamine oxidase
MSARRECDVAVVGAGLSGLAAARTARDAGFEVVVVEARGRCGGRLLNHQIGDGKVVELGGEWVGPTQKVVNAWIDELGLERFETYNEGFNLFDYRGRISRYTGAIPRINPIVLADIAQVQARVDRMARQVPLEAPWQAAKASRWDELTVGTWLRRATYTAGARAFFQLMVEAVWAAHPSDVSLLHFLFYVHSGGGFDNLISTDGGAQQHRIVGGSQLIAERLAASLGDAVVLGAPVRGVRDDGDSVVVVADGVEVQAARVIVAMPPTLAGRIIYDPPLPGHRDQLTQRVPQGTVIKCMAFYEEPFWRANDLSGQVTSDIGPVKVTFDNSPPDGSPGVLLGFLEGNQARQLGRTAPEVRRAAVLDCFARFFGDRARKPYDYVDHAWAEEVYSRGCYVGYFPTGVWTAYGTALREPVGRIHWAGTETATVCNGYMDGAISAGVRAAREAVGAGIPVTTAAGTGV